MLALRFILWEILAAATAIAAESSSIVDRGLAEARSGNCSAALIDLGGAISQAPVSIPALNATALCETMLSRPERATSSFETVSRLQPQAWQAWTNLGANSVVPARKRPDGHLGDRIVVGALDVVIGV